MDCDDSLYSHIQTLCIVFRILNRENKNGPEKNQNREPTNLPHPTLLACMEVMILVSLREVRIRELSHIITIGVLVVWRDGHHTVVAIWFYVLYFVVRLCSACSFVIFFQSSGNFAFFASYSLANCVLYCLKIYFQ